MNWNSIMRSVTAFAMYMALVIAHLAGVSALSFALLAAGVLCLGLCAHSFDLSQSVDRLAVVHPAPVSIMPSLTESVDQLHALQTEINELQAQFAVDTQSRSNTDHPHGSVG